MMIKLYGSLSRRIMESSKKHRLQTALFFLWFFQKQQNRWVQLKYQKQDKRNTAGQEGK